MNKHADVIDSIPTCVCLPREKRDEAYAAKLSKVLPVICERCGFEQIYSDNAWEKLKHGTAVYGIFWNSSLEDGLGDVDLRQLSLESEIFRTVKISLLSSCATERRSRRDFAALITRSIGRAIFL